MQIITNGYTAWDCYGCDKHCIDLIKDGSEPDNICNVKNGVLNTVCNWKPREKLYMSLVGNDPMG